MYVSKGLENHSTASISFLTLDWKFADFQRADFKPLEKLPPKPNKLEEMIRISRVLSEGIPFVRVDLYCIKDNIYFSELTFTPYIKGVTDFKVRYDYFNDFTFYISICQ